MEIADRFRGGTNGEWSSEPQSLKTPRKFVQIWAVTGVQGSSAKEGCLLSRPLHSFSRAWGGLGIAGRLSASLFLDAGIRKPLVGEFNRIAFANHFAMLPSPLRRARAGFAIGFLFPHSGHP